MNILIVGGLLALAVVAIVGAVLLGMGEERAEKQQKEESATSSMQASPAPQAPDATLPSTTSGVLPSTASETLSPTMSGVLPATTSGTLSSGELRTTRQLAPSLHEDEQAQRSDQLAVSSESAHPLAQRNGQLAVSNEEEYIVFLNGQIHALTGELRSLAQKASELEQRLNMLSETLESQPHPQNDASVKTPAFRKIGISSF